MKRPVERIVRACLLGLLLFLCPGSLHPQSSPEPNAHRLPTQLFTVRFKDVNDVYLLIEPLLSAKGSVSMQPRLKTLAVTDDEDTLRRVEEMIRSYDLPPKNVEVALQLILASTKGQPEKISPHPGVIDSSTRSPPAGPITATLAPRSPPEGKRQVPRWAGLSHQLCGGLRLR